MTTSIKILTTATLDSTPSILLLSPNGSKTLINCGEGCQRSFLESSLRLKSVNKICLTHLSHDSLGGLPGTILTTADATTQATINESIAGGNMKLRNAKMLHKHAKQQQQQQQNNTNFLPDLELIGPVGIKSFHHALRYFMRRDAFHIAIHEGCYKSRATSGSGEKMSRGLGRRNKKKKKQQQQQENDSSSSTNAEGFMVESIPMSIPSPSSCKIPIPIASYLFKTPPIQGKFLPHEAKKLGIPPGPLYGQLKNGKTVEFTNEKGEIKVVKPEEVLMEGQPPSVVLILYCPTVQVLDMMRDVSSIGQFYKEEKKENGDKKNGEEEATLDIVVHFTPKQLFYSEEYQAWLHRFDENVEHLVLHINQNLVSTSLETNEKDRVESNGNSNSDTIKGDIVIDGSSPFRSATQQALSRSFLNEDIYPSPLHPRLSELIEKDYGNTKEDVKMEQATNGMSNEKKKIAEERNHLKIIQGKPLMEYILIPRPRMGINPESIPPEENNDNNEHAYRKYGVSKKEAMELYKNCIDSGAIQLAKEISSSHIEKNGTSKAATAEEKEKKNDFGELIFTGTGSALPCKHRNVTGMYLRMANGNAIMLDVGEGTTGLLLRSWKHSTATTHANGNLSVKEEFQKRIRGIKAVWISHPHADHHLGLLRLLAERNALCSTSNGEGNDPLVLIAPPSMFRFLSEYTMVDPSIAGSYLALDCRDVLSVEQQYDRNSNHNNNQQQRHRPHPLVQKIKNDLGITNITSVPVSHCQHSYAVIIDNTSFGRVAYSGDCRPSSRFASMGYNADLLIHEATFENGMEEEAMIKKHCTVGEALDVGRRMNAKAVVLTHFSQRYPRIPPLGDDKKGAGRSTSDESSSKRQKVSENRTKNEIQNTQDDNENNNGDDDLPVVFAFDFMTLKPSNVNLASKLTTAVRLLYPDDKAVATTEGKSGVYEDDILMNTVNNGASSKSMPSAKEMLSVPGAFAAKGVL